MEKFKVKETIYQQGAKPSRQFREEQKQLKKDARPTRAELHQAAREQKKYERLRPFVHDNAEDWLNRIQNDPEFRADRIANMDKAVKFLAVFCTFLEIMRRYYPAQSIIPYVETFLGFFLTGVVLASVYTRMQ